MTDYRENNHWTVYVHTSPSGKYYVGITGRNPERRWGSDGCGYKSTSHFFNAINKYGWANIDHEIVAKNLTKKEAEDFEKKLIQTLHSNDKRFGYNISNGGTGGNNKPKKAVDMFDLDGNYIRTFESAADAARYIGGKATRTHITACCTHRAHKAYGYLFEYSDNNYFSVTPYIRCTQYPIDQYDLFGNFICSYKSVFEAEQKTGLRSSDISRCIKTTKTNYAFGYVWVLHGEPFVKYKPFHKCGKKILQFDTNTKRLVREFHSLADAAEYCKKSVSYFIRKIKQDNTYLGYIWIRKEQLDESSFDGSFLLEKKGA